MVCSSRSPSCPSAPPGPGPIYAPTTEQDPCRIVRPCHGPRPPSVRSPETAAVSGLIIAPMASCTRPFNDRTKAQRHRKECQLRTGILRSTQRPTPASRTEARVSKPQDLPQSSSPRSPRSLRETLLSPTLPGVSRAEIPEIAEGRVRRLRRRSIEEEQCRAPLFGCFPHVCFPGSCRGAA